MAAKVEVFLLALAKVGAAEGEAFENDELFLFELLQVAILDTPTSRHTYTSTTTYSIVNGFHCHYLAFVLLTL